MLFYASCGMIAWIREVAVGSKIISTGRFLRGANVRNNYGDKSLYQILRLRLGPESGVQVVKKHDTPDNVYSHHLSYCFRKYE